MNYSSAIKKEWNTCFNMDEPWKKPVTKNPPIIWFQLFATSRMGTRMETEGGLGVVQGWEGWLRGRHVFLRQQKCSAVDCGDSCTTLYYTKNHRTVHCKWVNCVACKLYPNNAITKKGKVLPITVPTSSAQESPFPHTLPNSGHHYCHFKSILLRFNM